MSSIDRGMDSFVVPDRVPQPPFRCTHCNGGNVAVEIRYDEGRIFVRIVCRDCSQKSLPWTYTLNA